MCAIDVLEAKQQSCAVDAVGSTKISVCFVSHLQEMTQKCAVPVKINVRSVEEEYNKYL